MAYQLSLNDMQEVESKLNSQGSSSPSKNNGYSLSLDEMKQIDEKKRQEENPQPYTGGLTADQTINSGKGLLAGLLKGGQGIGEFLAKGVRPIAKKVGIPVSDSFQNSLGGQVSQKSIDKLYSPDVASTPEGKIFFNVGEAAPLLGTPLGEGGAVMQGVKAALTSEALSPTFRPEKSLKEAYTAGIEPSAITGAIASSLGLPRGIGKVLGMGGTATPEEFARNIAAADRKPIGIGETSEAPYVTGIEQNTLNNLPFSGHAQKSKSVGKMLDNEVTIELKDLNKVPSDKPRYKLTGDSENPVEAVPTKTASQKISENFSENFQENEAKKRDLYEKRNQIAKNLDLNVTPDKLKTEAIGELKEVQEELNRKRKSNVSPETVSDLKAAGISAVDKEGNPISQDIPFRKINFEKGDYSEKANIARREGRRNDARIYEKLSRALESDFRSTIEKSGSDELKAAQYSADKHYQEKIAPILNNDKLHDHAIGEADKDSVIKDFLTTGQYESPTKLNAFLKNLSPEYRDQFTHEFLTRGLKHIGTPEEVESNKGISDAVLTTYSKLGPETKRLMFSTKTIKYLDRAYKARKLMGGSIDQMINPKTGYSHSKLITGGVAAGAVAGLSASLQHIGLSTPEALAAATAIIGSAGRGASAYATSDLAKNVYGAAARLKQVGTKIDGDTGLRVPKKYLISPVSLSPLLTNETQEENQ